MSSNRKRKCGQSNSSDQNYPNKEAKLSTAAAVLTSLGVSERGKDEKTETVPLSPCYFKLLSDVTFIELNGIVCFDFDEVLYSKDYFLDREKVLDFMAEAHFAGFLIVCVTARGEVGCPGDILREFFPLVSMVFCTESQSKFAALNYLSKLKKIPLHRICLLDDDYVLWFKEVHQGGAVFIPALREEVKSSMDYWGLAKKFIKNEKFIETDEYKAMCGELFKLEEEYQKAKEVQQMELETSAKVGMSV